MTDMNGIKVFPFYGKVENGLFWGKRSLAKGKRCGFKDLLVEKLSIPKVDEDLWFSCRL
jgi:hypothetical protein